MSGWTLIAESHHTGFLWEGGFRVPYVRKFSHESQLLYQSPIISWKLIFFVKLDANE